MRRRVECSPPEAAARGSAVKVLAAVLRVLWASPATLIGLGVGAGCLLAGARLRWHSGVLEVSLRGAGRARRARLARLAQRAGRSPPAATSGCAGPFVAITLGHVVLATSALEQSRQRAHERVHVRQYERWGPLFLLAYPAESVWQWLRGRRAYLDNRFEVAARGPAGAGPAPVMAAAGADVG